MSTEVSADATAAVIDAPAAALAPMDLDTAPAETKLSNTAAAAFAPVIHVHAEAITTSEPADDEKEAAPVEEPAPEPKILVRAEVSLTDTAAIKIWRRDADGELCFPEFQDPEFAVPGLMTDKAPLAVCISGGGFRATTLALGWLRGMQHLGLLSKVRYLSVISGASWLGAALCFQPSDNVATFLGPYVGPEECNLKALADVGDNGKSYARAVADAKPVPHYVAGAAITAVQQLRQRLRERLAGLLGISIKEQKEVARHWTTAMADAFLKPFGLGETDKSTIRVPGTQVAAKVEERAAALGRGDRIYDANVQDLPFLIIGQALLLPKEDSKFYPFEWTPLYGGCPALYDNVSPKLGAGWVEALGLNAQLLTNPNTEAAAEEVEVRPMGPASLAEATGISSGYISMMMTATKPDLNDRFQKILGFHSAKVFNMQDWETHDLLLTDGGAYDLYGIFPALRRQLPNIMVFNCNGRSLVTDLEAFSSDKDLPGLFGCGTDSEYNRMHQVFKPEGFNKLFEALKAKKESGEAPVHADHYEVLENKHLGIKGGWTTRVMWVINESMSHWEAKLPQETQAAIKPATPTPKGGLIRGEAGLEEFPYVDTSFMDYTPELVSLLANHAAWMLVSNEQLVRDMLGGSTTGLPADNPVAGSAEPAAVQQ
ncbi:hypothetical protein PLESTF_000975200 [Pleodorina starrii]|nr:hypothetical protein PLESTM_000846400 [Pleodorina starrii]GLC70453.1 hypothetical protein PLESTF_000975200 [Pleodorina starrii]